jgi:hypothetical protein
VGACAWVHVRGHYPPPELIFGGGGGGPKKTPSPPRHSMAPPLKEPPELRGLLEACWKGWHAVCGWLCFALLSLGTGAKPKTTRDVSPAGAVSLAGLPRKRFLILSVFSLCELMVRATRHQRNKHPVYEGEPFQQKKTEALCVSGFRIFFRYNRQVIEAVPMYPRDWVDMR